ncbi:MAG: ATP-binding protein [Dorea sp.]|nr:ATP-binding protein [Dorea sp.]
MPNFKEIEEMKRTVTFVIGANATGKTTFIKNYFSDSNAVILNVYDYQQVAYKEAGYDKHIPFGEEFKCLYKANEHLLTDVIEMLQQGRNVVLEQTMFKAKRRIRYIDVIRNTLKDIIIEVYVMCPSDSVWETYVTERKLAHYFQQLKAKAEEIEFPNPSEGFDKIYEVIDNDIRLRMDASKPEIVDVAHKELSKEAQRMKQEEEETKQRSALLEGMNSRPFWHYCESCGAKIYCTAQEAFDNGWDYPPRIGAFGVLGPRTCGNCTMIDTLYLKVMKQKIPIVIESSLTEKELRTWRRIKNEPESLLEEEKII